MSESSGSESVGVSQANLKRNSRPRLDSPAVSHDSGSGNKLALPPSAAAASPSKNSDTHRFVGTVDVSDTHWTRAGLIRLLPAKSETLSSPAVRRPREHSRCRSWRRCGLGRCNLVGMLGNPGLLVQEAAEAD